MEKKHKIIIFCLVTFAVIRGSAWFMFDFLPVYSSKQMVLSHLVDPDSAKFTVISHEKNAEGNCGSVNSKNRMGGYTGFIKFITFKDGTVRFEPKDVSIYSTPDQQLNANYALDEFSRISMANCFPDVKY